MKKTLPLVVLSGILLVGCANNNVVPKNNETPMEDVRDAGRQLENDAERDIEGRDIDNGNQNGMNNNQTPNENGQNEGDMNNNLDNNPQVEIIEDLNRKNNVE